MLPDHKAMGIGVMCIRQVVFLTDELPLLGVYGGKIGIARALVCYQCLVDAVSQRQGGSVQLATANDHDFIIFLVGMQCLIKRCVGFAAGKVFVRAANHNIVSARQGTANGFVGFAPHDDGFAHGDLLEVA